MKEITHNCQCLECYEIYNFDDFIGFPINHPPKTTEAALPQQPRKERNEAIFQQQCRCRAAAIQGKQAQLDQLAKTHQKLIQKKSGKLTDNTYTFSNLTNFGHKFHPFNRNGNTECCFEIALNTKK